MREVIIWGAGRIGRGFTAEVFKNPDWHTTFVDIDAQLISKLNCNKKYTIFKTGEIGINEVVVDEFHALEVLNVESLKKLFLTKNPLVVVAVHAPKLPEVMSEISQYLCLRAAELPDDNMDIMFNVNLVGTAKLCKGYIAPELLEYVDQHVGFVETMVMRISPFAPSELLQKDELAVLQNDYPDMPADSFGFKAPVPQLPMLRLTDDIHAEEVRKIYTLNMAHALLCYLGVELGLETVLEAVNNETIRKILLQAFDEVAIGLCGEFGYAKENMSKFNSEVMKMLENPWIGDYLLRLGADTRRKLALTDRLTGSALLCQKHGGKPKAIAVAIAAGLRFKNSDDGTIWVIQTIEKYGILKAIEMICGLKSDNDLTKLILDNY